MQIPGYQIERELGQGGMAIVYLAMQESLHRHVALKVIKPALTADEEFAQRFLREGRIIAQLNDPHIVTVYDIGSHNDIYYLSMEYLPGGTLQQRIRAGLPPPEALSIARAIASALHYAHCHQIIHRDIKPQNILFRENNSPVLTDFGIAKTLGGSTIMTQTGLSLGTPRYMSPEQIRGQAVDARADLYSFGVLLYEMLTGHAPYAAEDSFALAMMHVTAPIPELPPQLARYQPLLNKLLEKNPAQRFQNGQEIIAALDALETPSVELASPRRLNWKTSALAAVLTGAVIAGGYLFLNPPAPAPQPPVASTPVPPTTPSAIDPAAQQRAEADQLLAQAVEYQKAGSLTDSLARIEQGLRLVPDHSVLLTMREQVSRQIDDANKARQAQDRQQQVRLQAEQFLDQARRAQQEGALDLSLARIEQGLRAMPDHVGLLTLKRDILEQQAERQRQQDTASRQAAAIERQRIEAERQRLEAERQRLEAERRRAELAEQQRLEAERQQAEAERRQRKADEFLEQALDYQRDHAYEASLAHIEQGLRQVPDHSRLLALRDEVRDQRRVARTTPPPEPVVKPPVDDTARLAALLKQCDAHLKAKRLTSGKGGNAADCYGEVLKLDRGNSEALAGLDGIADHYANQAALALERGNIKATQRAIESLAQLNSADPRLSELRQRLTDAQAAAKPVAPPPEKTVSPPPVATREPPPAPPEPPTKLEAPPIDLVSLPLPTKRPAASAPPPAEPAPPGPEPTEKPLSAAQAWATLQDSADPAEIEQFLALYPKSRQAVAARAKLRQLQQSQQPQAPKQPASGLTARLAIQADVEDAQVILNGRNIGTTPLEVELKPGPYKVRVSLEGHQDWNGRVYLAAGDDNTLTAVLPKKQMVATAPLPTPSEPPNTSRAPKPTDDQTEQPIARRQPVQPPASEPPSTGTPGGSNCLRGNCRNGQGAYRHPDGSEYSGEFRNAKMHGQGTYSYAKRGEKYVGEWRDGIIDGQGTYYYRTGNRYEGEWRNGHKSGQGTYFYANGDRYVGEFEDDQPNGQGTYYYRNGDRYEGEWRDGQKHGQGVLYENGKKIVGEWQNDQKVRISVEP